MSALAKTLPTNANDPGPWDDLDNARVEDCHIDLEWVGRDFDTMVNQLSDGLFLKRRDGLWHATWSGSREVVTASERTAVDALHELRMKLASRVKEGW